MQFVRHLVETKLKQNAKASKINAFIKNGADPIARPNKDVRCCSYVIFLQNIRAEVFFRG